MRDKGEVAGVEQGESGAYHVHVARESRVRDARVALKVAQACRARESHRRPPASPEGEVGGALSGIGRWQARQWVVGEAVRGRGCVGAL